MIRKHRWDFHYLRNMEPTIAGKCHICRTCRHMQSARGLSLDLRSQTLVCHRADRCAQWRAACAVPRNDMYSRATCSRVHRTRTENEDSAKYTTCCIAKMQERLVGKDHNNRSVWGFRSFLVLLILILALNPDPCSFRTPNYMEIVVILFFFFFQ